MIETVIITLLFLGFYPYVVYPLLVRVLFVFVSRTRPTSRLEKSVTVVIAAFNEETSIRSTVKNKLEQDYPAHLLDVVVVSDGSTDKTDEIVAELAESSGRVRLVRQERAGKTAGLNLVVKSLESEIVVFSDANSLFSNDAVQNLVNAFGDASVGYVTGRMEYQAEEGSVAGAGSSAYMRYENQLRVWESKVGSVVGVDGGVDAVRRTLYQPMNASELPDFSLPLRVVEQGYRVVYEPSAVVLEDALKSTGDEFRMRVRVSARAMWTLIDFRHLLNPLRFGLFSFQLLSHKWMRYFSFVPFLAAYVLALSSLSESLVSLIISIAMTLALLAGALCIFAPSWVQSLTFFRFSAYFLLINAASALAFVRVLSGKRVVTWQPRVG